jgi:hypothetical protein
MCDLSDRVGKVLVHFPAMVFAVKSKFTEAR